MRVVPFATVMGTSVLLSPPALSPADTLILYGPSDMRSVSHTTSYGVVASSPMNTSLTLNHTWSTPKLSATLAEILTAPRTVPPLTGDTTATTGGVLSTVTGMSTDAVLPAVSRASAV